MVGMAAMSVGRFSYWLLVAMVISLQIAEAAVAEDVDDAIELCIKQHKSKRTAALEARCTFYLGADQTLWQVERCINDKGTAPWKVSVNRCTALLQSDSFTPAGTADILIYRAQAYVGGKDYDRAIADYDRAIELSHGAKAYSGRGIAQWFKKNYVAAVADLSEAIQFESDNVDALGYRADAYQSLGEEDRALGDLASVVRLAPKTAWAYFKRGEIFAKRREYDRAIREFDQAIRINRNAESLMARGRARFYNRQFEDARFDFGESARLEPKSAAAWAWRCGVLAVTGELEAALRDCDKAFQLEPGSALALEGRGLIYLKSKAFDKALVDFDAAVEHAPSTGTPLYGRGLAKIRTGDERGGAEDLDSARTYWPAVGEAFKAWGVE